MNARYRTIAENISDALIIHDCNGTIIDVNNNACTLFGYSRIELIGTDMAILRDAGRDETYDARIKDIRKNGKLYFTSTIHKRRDGSVFPVEISSSLVSDQGNGIIHSFFRDAADRIATQNALTAEHDRLTVTLRSIADAVISTDVSGNIVLMNNVAEELTGYQAEEAVGKPLVEILTFIHELSRQPFNEPVDALFSHSPFAPPRRNVLLVSRHGFERVVVGSCAPITDTASTIVGKVLVLRDNTEKQKADEQIIKAQKLESIGVLAGGIAHDFNNLLFGISGYINLAEQCADSNEKVTSLLGKTHGVLTRAQTLTRQLLTFSKGGAPLKAILDIGAVTRDMTQLALSGSNVSCTFAIPENLWMCEADESQINQVIEHMVTNARQAMPNGGTVHVSAENYVLFNNRFPFLNHGNYIKLIISDTGDGIAQENLHKIFDPFFTTKKKSTGLGLTTCYSILRKHDGYIDVQSRIGMGTTFYLYIPAKEQVPIPLPIMQSVSHRGEGRILVMDDEDFIRDILNKMLTDMGYTVELASHGEEAITLLKTSLEQQCPYSAVILDMTIPAGMGGKETIQELRKLYPEIKAIASSGYSDDPIMAAPSLFGFSDKIRKPYRKEDLTRVLARVLPEKAS